MNIIQFKQACYDLQNFMDEQDKLDAVIKVIATSSTGVVEFGNEFIDAYIRVVEIAMNDDGNWFSWFVFENDFGAKKMVVSIKDATYVISNENEMFDLYLKLQDE